MIDVIQEYPTYCERVNQLMSILQAFDFVATYSPGTGDIFVSQTLLSHNIIHRLGVFVCNAMNYLDPFKDQENLRLIDQDLFKTNELPLPEVFLPDNLESTLEWKNLTDT